QSGRVQSRSRRLPEEPSLAPGVTCETDSDHLPGIKRIEPGEPAAQDSPGGMTMETVGMIGVGAMGSALLERLRLAHVEPVVFDVSSEAMDAARALGAEPAASPADVARSATLVDVVVRSDDDVLDCA